MSEVSYYYYEVIRPIKDYGFNLAIGDLVGDKELKELPPYYKKNCVKLLESPILRKT